MLPQISLTPGNAAAGVQRCDSTRQVEPLIAVLYDCVAEAAIRSHAAGVRGEHTDLARYVGSRIKGICQRVERRVADVVNRLEPVVLRFKGGLDCGEVLLG